MTYSQFSDYSNKHVRLLNMHLFTAAYTVCLQHISNQYCRNYSRNHSPADNRVCKQYLAARLLLILHTSALTLLVGWQEGHPTCKKTEWWGAGVVICLERVADLHMAQLMQLPLTVSCFSKIHTGFTFLVPAHPGSPGQRAVKRLCVCVFTHQNCFIFCTQVHTIHTSTCSLTMFNRPTLMEIIQVGLGPQKSTLSD